MKKLSERLHGTPAPVSAPPRMNDLTLVSVAFYLIAAGLVFVNHSKLLGVSLIANAAIALAVGLVARSMGKRETAAVLLGLLLGPLGALAGMIAAPSRN